MIARPPVQTTRRRPDINEKQWQAIVVSLARYEQWRLIYHTAYSVGSAAGFPDLVLARAPRVIFAELKSNTGAVTPKQEDWLAELVKCCLTDDELTLLGRDRRRRVGVEAYLWRPSDEDRVRAILARRP